MTGEFDGCLNLKIEKELYTIPAAETFSNFRDVFEQGILTLPSSDNPKMLGLKNNQEIVKGYLDSKATFRLLSGFFQEVKFNELDDRLLEKAQTNEFLTAIKRDEESLMRGCMGGFLDYGLLMIEKYEKSVSSGQEIIEIINSIVGAFSSQQFDAMYSSLTVVSELPVAKTVRKIPPSNLTGTRNLLEKARSGPSN